MQEEGKEGKKKIKMRGESRKVGIGVWKEGREGGGCGLHAVAASAGFPAGLSHV